MIVVLAYYYGEFEKVTRKNVESPELDPLEE
jgi:hypothetical protein